MAKRLKASSLLLGQVDSARSPKQGSLAEFYSGVSKGQTGAIQKKATETTEATRGLAGDLGLDQTEGDDGKVKTTLKDDSKFRSTVAIPEPITGNRGTYQDDYILGGPPPPVVAPGTDGKVSVPGQVVMPRLSGGTDVDSLKRDERAISDAIIAAGSSVEEWKASGLSAAEYINELNRKNAEAAGEAAKEAQERLTEKKLGARGQQSELEKQASDYTNVIASEPGTSNIKALANLTKFYDMGKYGALESGIRQGELALARQEAQSDLAAQQSAESMRAAAISEYGKQSKELGGILQSEVEAANEAERKRVEDYYKTGLETAQKQKGELETQLADVSGRRKAEEIRVEQQLDNDYKDISLKLFGDGGDNKGFTGTEASMTQARDIFKNKLNSMNETWEINKWSGFSKDKGHVEEIVRLSQKRLELFQDYYKKAQEARKNPDKRKALETLKFLYDRIESEERRFAKKLREEVEKMSYTGQKKTGLHGILK